MGPSGPWWTWPLAPSSLLAPGPSRASLICGGHAASPLVSPCGCVVVLRHFWKPASSVLALSPGPTRGCLSPSLGWGLCARWGPLASPSSWDSAATSQVLPVPQVYLSSRKPPWLSPPLAVKMQFIHLATLLSKYLQRSFTILIRMGASEGCVPAPTEDP